MKKPDCYYYGGGYCDKAAPFTPCEFQGCVAYIDHKPMALAGRRATDFAFSKYPFRYDSHGDVIDFENTVILQGVCRIGYMQAQKDVIAIINTRISEIMGDAQPNPVLRIELNELIKRINDENNK